MKKSLQDPLGAAILDFAKTKKPKDVIVRSEICDDDTIPSAYLHRSYDEMPLIEKKALELCKGSILDIGAGAGIHASWLSEHNFTVEAIDISPMAVQYMQSKGLNASACKFEDYESKKHDTLLMLMNGIGIAGELSNLKSILLKAKELLLPQGQIICDSTDIKYLYEDDEGGLWIDLNAEYYGNFKFQMKFKEHETEWFDWLYVDFENLSKIAEDIGLEANKMHEEDNHFLAVLKHK